MSLTKSLKKSWGIGKLFHHTISNQYQKKLSEAQIKRKKHKAFMCFDKISLIISRVGTNNYMYEEQIDICRNCINQFKNQFPEFEQLSDKLEESLFYCSKKVIKQPNLII